MDNYSNDQDLEFHRPNLQQLLPDVLATWDDYHAEAKEIIDRAIETGWYRVKIQDYLLHPFDPALMDAAQLKRASCFKTLELIFSSLDTGLPDSTFTVFRGYYRDMYETEIRQLIDYGLKYDFTGDGTAEQTISYGRRLERC